MSDGVYYKHLRDHGIRHEDVQAELYTRKWLIREGRSHEYKPPHFVKATLGLLDGVPVADPPPPPPLSPLPDNDTDVYANWINNPWQNYLLRREESVLAKLAAQHWVVA